MVIWKWSDLLKRDKRFSFFLCVSDLSTQSTRIQRRYGRAATRKKRSNHKARTVPPLRPKKKKRQEDKKRHHPENLAHQRQRGKQFIFAGFRECLLCLLIPKTREKTITAKISSINSTPSRNARLWKTKWRATRVGPVSHRLRLHDACYLNKQFSFVFAPVWVRSEVNKEGAEMCSRTFVGEKDESDPCLDRSCSWPRDGSEGESGIGLLRSLLRVVDSRGRVVE
jgi:hypothetical protein